MKLTIDQAIKLLSAIPSGARMRVSKKLKITPSRVTYYLQTFPNGQRINTTESIKVWEAIIEDMIDKGIDVKKLIKS